MRSYIKIFGPPILEAIVELEKLAIDMPGVCIMDHFIKSDISPSAGRPIRTHDVTIPGFVMHRTGVVIPVKRCQSIISKHGIKLGEYDFFFEWHKKPSTSQITDLIGKIDEALKPLGCLYTITTK